MMSSCHKNYQLTFNYNLKAKQGELSPKERNSIEFSKERGQKLHNFVKSTRICHPHKEKERGTATIRNIFYLRFFSSFFVCHNFYLPKVCHVIKLIFFFSLCSFRTLQNERQTMRKTSSDKLKTKRFASILNYQFKCSLFLQCHLSRHHLLSSVGRLQPVRKGKEN